MSRGPEGGATTSTPEIAPLHQRLLDAGIPVIVCRPHRHHEHCPFGCSNELTMPTGWQSITVERARDLIGEFRPDVDTLAMVGGHGIDVLDIDSKAGGDVNDVPPEVVTYGRTRTPSGGWHLAVPSTGHGKGDLYIGGKYVGDYVGGTKDGGSRLLCFLPGSTRPKYPDADYVEEVPWDIDALLDSEPDDLLLSILAASSLTTHGVAGRRAVTGAEAKEFLAEHSEAVQCPYGQKALRGILEQARDIVDGNGNGSRGRHAWACRSTNRVVELIRAGCLDASAFREVESELHRRKPEGGTDMGGLLTWAVANASGGTRCEQHGEPIVIEGLEPAPQPIGLDAAREVFDRWLGKEYDLDALHFALALSAVESLDGDAPWGLIVSGSGNAKTETVAAAAGAGARVTSTITSEGALLSATSRRERTKDATGGLLRAIGDRGVLVIKDVTSILSMNRDARASTLGALREVADGFWERNVGTDGGKTLTWKGRIVVIGAVTTAWDTHHAVISSMGDRFLLLRVDSTQTKGRIASGRQSLANIGHEVTMRQDLATAFGGVMAGMDSEGAHLTEADGEVLLGLADIVTLARTAVERDHQGNVIDAHAPEAPTRLVKYLGQVMRGGIAIGMDRDDALRLAVRVAHDCVPPLRLAALGAVNGNAGQRTSDIVTRLQRPRTTVDRALQELHLLGLVEVSIGQGETIWRYSIAKPVDRGSLSDLVDGGRPFTRKVTDGTQGHQEESDSIAPTSTDKSGEVSVALVVEVAL